MLQKRKELIFLSFFLFGLRLKSLLMVNSFAPISPPLSLAFFSHTFFNQVANSGGSHGTMDNVLASYPAAPGSILGPPVPRFINHCLVSAQWTVAFEQTHLVLSRDLQIQWERTSS